MALIVDKHRPKSLDALTYHEELSERLRSLVLSIPPPSETQLLTVRPRHNMEIFPTFLSTALPAQARRRGSSPH